MLYPQANAQRQLISLDGFWKFKPDPDDIGENGRWFDGLTDHDELAVPGSWNDQRLDLFHFFGKGWYELIVHVPLYWKGLKVWLRVGSANMNACVWVNGQFAGKHVGPHLPFEFDITSLTSFGEELRITICVDNSLDPWSLPPARVHDHEARAGNFNSHPSVTYDFYPYGGIHRPVVLYATAPNRIEDITVRTDIHGTTGIILCEVMLTRPSVGKLLLRSAGQTVQTKINNSQSVMVSFEIPDARLWDIGQPNLYVADIELIEDGTVVDAYHQTYGVRTVRVEGNKFLLNNREVSFKGFGKHEDFHACGKGLNRCLIVKDFDLLKWVGANSFRTTHYPYAEDWLDFADRHGVMVINETPFVGMGDRLGTQEILQKAQGVVQDFVNRDKNHPCVVMWSLANEPWLDSKGGEMFLTEICKLTRQLDDTRPITYVAYREPENNPAMRHYDIVCINKYYGWYDYPGLIDYSLPDLLACMDRFYEAFKKPIIVAEFGADAVEGLHTMPALMFSEEYQAEIICKQYEAILTRDYCVGAHVWAFADFLANQSPTRIVYNRKGIFTRERNPKMAAYKLRELWLSLP